MWIKIIIVVLMLAIIFSLFRSLYFLTTEKDSKKTVKNLSWRIGLSIFLFLVILAGIYTGVIETGGLPQIEQPQP